jgi:hypothetical protein
MTADTRSAVSNGPVPQPGAPGADGAEAPGGNGAVPYGPAVHPTNGTAPDRAPAPWPPDGTANGHHPAGALPAPNGLAPEPATYGPADGDQPEPASYGPPEPDQPDPASHTPAAGAQPGPASYSPADGNQPDTASYSPADGGQPETASHGPVRIDQAEPATYGPADGDRPEPASHGPADQAEPVGHGPVDGDQLEPASHGPAEVEAAVAGPVEVAVAGPVEVDGSGPEADLVPGPVDAQPPAVEPVGTDGAPAPHDLRPEADGAVTYGAHLITEPPADGPLSAAGLAVGVEDPLAEDGPVPDEVVAAEVADRLGAVVGEDVEADPAEFAAAAVLDVLRASGWADAAEAAELRAEAERTRELLNLVVRDHRAREASAAGTENQQLYWLVPLLRAAHGVAFGSLGAKVALRTAVQDVPPEVLAQAGLRIDYGVEPTDDEAR